MTALAQSRNPTGSALLDLVLRFRALGLLLALAVLVGATAAVNARFLSGQSVRDLLFAKLDAS